MSSVVLTGDTSGAGTITVPAVAGTFTATMGSATGTHFPFSSSAAVSGSGQTSINFTSIPSWVKRITVMFSSLSTNGTSVPLIRIGDSGGLEDTGYLSAASSIGSVVNSANNTAGFPLNQAHAAASVYNGIAVIALIDSATNTWAYQMNLGYSNGSTTAVAGGSKALSATLDRLTMIMANGTDTFDAGTLINILYE
jgi:hypothetical protein